MFIIISSSFLFRASVYRFLLALFSAIPLSLPGLLPLNTEGAFSIALTFVIHLLHNCYDSDCEGEIV